MVDNIFTEWLYSELNSREWSQSDLARKTGVSRQVISRLVNGERNPGVDTCQALAHAFNLPPEFVFRKAGLLPAKNPIDEEAERLAYQIAMLPPDDKKRMEIILESFVDHDKNQAKKKSQDTLAQNR